MTDNIINLNTRRLQTTSSLVDADGAPITMHAPAQDANQEPLPPVPDTHPISAPFVGQVACLAAFMIDAVAYFGPRLEGMAVKTAETKRQLHMLNSTFQAMQAALDGLEAWAQEAMPGHPKPLQAMQEEFTKRMVKQMQEETPITTDLAPPDGPTAA